MREAMLTYFHAEKQASLLVLLAGVDALVASGLARMARVMSWFRIYEGIEIVLIAGGLALTALYPGRQAGLPRGGGAPGRRRGATWMRRRTGRMATAQNRTTTTTGT